MKVLFVCIHNSARSQMAEAYLKELGGDRFEVYSAGLEQGALNSVVVDAMKLVGIDISGNKSNTVEEFLDPSFAFDFVITVCDAANGERCPVFPGGVKRLHWGFEDPSGLAGSYEDKLKTTCVIRDEIKQMVVAFIEKNKK